MKKYFTAGKHFLCVFAFSLLLIASKAQPKLIGAVPNGGYQFGTIFTMDPGATSFSSLLKLDGNGGHFPNKNGFAEGSNGKFYSTTETGGANNTGVLFEYDPATDVYVTRVSFFGSLGQNLHGSASVTAAAPGKLIGVTYSGGTSNLGVLFEYDYITDICTPKLDLSNTLGGGNILGGFVKAGNGKFYCVTNTAGPINRGTIIEYDYATNTLIKRADMTVAGGYENNSLMVEGPNGKLYGTTFKGGSANDGVIFEYDYTTNTYTTKINFTGNPGINARAGLCLAPNGKFYGVLIGGGNNLGGVIFEYDYVTNTYTKKINMSAALGTRPESAMVLASNGKLYGETRYGGINNVGTIYEYDYINNIATKKVDMGGANGGEGSCAMRESNGKLYAAVAGGVFGSTLFSYDLPSGVYSRKKNLGRAENGSSIYGTPVKASNGKIYCVAKEGASDTAYAGSILEYDPVLNTYTKKIEFLGPNGRYPTGGMTEAPNGKLYGTTYWGGVLNYDGGGTIFEYDYTTNTYTMKIDLGDGNDGKYPQGSMLLAGNGKFYGTMPFGGAANNGVLFSYDYITNIYTDLHDFPLGQTPGNKLMEAANGKIYGGTGNQFSSGTVFEYNYNTNVFTTKKTLGQAHIDGAAICGFVEATPGKLYGTTNLGGFFNRGVICEYDYINNDYTVKLELTLADGWSPSGAMIKSSGNGKLYGMASAGGDNNAGTIFEYDHIANTYTRKISFDLLNGSNPFSDLVEITNGCSPASQPVIAATGTTICDGSQLTLSIQSGQLNESDHWSWYSGSCGGTFLGSGPGISFTPQSSATYYVRGEGGCATNGICGNITVNIVSTLTASVDIVSDMGSTICAGTSVTFTATPTNGGSNPSYKWKKNGNNVGTDSNGYTDASLASGDIITCELTSSETCVTNSPATSNSIVFVVNIATNSTTNIAICASELPYHWNGVDYFAQGTYQASFTNAAGCDSTAFLNLSLNLTPIAGITNNTGTTQLSCAVTSISVTATGGATYLWSSGLGTDANATITTAGTYTVTVTSADGCSAQASITVTVNPAGLPAPSDITGFVNVCTYVGNGTQLAYTATPVVGANSYQWTVPPTVNIISGQGTNQLTVTLDAAFASSGNKQLRVVAIAPCGTSPYTIKYLVAQLPGSIPAIAGPVDVCPFLGNGLEAVYSIPVISGAVSYQWNVPAGANIAQNNENSINVTFDNSFVTNTISVFAINGCGVSNTRSITVKRVLPSKPAIITGISNPCLFMPSIAFPSGTTATYSVSRIIGNTYNWTVPAGASISLHSNTPTTDYIEVSFTSAYTGGDISVTTSNGCGISPERVFKLIVFNPAIPGTITGVQIQPCPVRQYQYSIAAIPSHAVSAQWTVPANATIVSGQGSTSIIVSYPDFTVGTVSVVGNNGCGSSAARTINVTLPQCQPEFTGGDKGNTNTSLNKGGSGLIQQQQMEVNVFPNPTNSSFKLQVFTTGIEKINVRLTDMQGRMLKTFITSPNLAVEFGNELKAGVYVVEVLQAGKIKKTRLIKF